MKNLSTFCAWVHEAFYTFNGAKEFNFVAATMHVVTTVNDAETRALFRCSLLVSDFWPDKVGPEEDKVW